jgi:hypothetical protein
MVIEGIQSMEAEVWKILAIINEQKNNFFFFLANFVEKAIESLLECIVIETKGGLDGFENTCNGYEKLLQVTEPGIVKQKHRYFIVCAELLRQLM